MLALLTRIYRDQPKASMGTRAEMALKTRYIMRKEKRNAGCTEAAVHCGLMKPDWTRQSVAKEDREMSLVTFIGLLNHLVETALHYEIYF